MRFSGCLAPQCCFRRDLDLILSKWRQEPALFQHSCLRRWNIIVPVLGQLKWTDHSNHRDNKTQFSIEDYEALIWLMSHLWFGWNAVVLRLMRIPVQLPSEPCLLTSHVSSLRKVSCCKWACVEIHILFRSFFIFHWGIS